MSLNKSKKTRNSILILFSLSMNIFMIKGAGATDSIFEMVIPPPPDPQAHLKMVYEDNAHRTIMEFDEGYVKEDKSFFFMGISYSILTPLKQKH